MSAPPPLTEAINELQAVGLTESEAKCFVTLTRVSSGTARDVSEVGDIPRSRVYDLAERLQDRGLVEVQEGNPRQFRAVSPKLAAKKLEREYLDHLDGATTALEDVSGTHTDDGGDGVWTIDGVDNVLERGQAMVAEADAELFALVTEAALIEDECLIRLHDAIDRGVDVILALPDERGRTELAGELPDATIWEPNLNWQTLPAEGDQVGRVVMADREMVMITTLGEERLPGVYDESAIWGKGQANGLVIVMQQILGTHLDQLGTTTNTSGLPL